jgi:peptidoglycan-associated lipoprotein
MKKLLIGALISTVVSTTIYAKECPTTNERIGFGVMGVLQGTILGGPVGAFWALATIAYADGYDKECTEKKSLEIKESIETKPVKEEKIVKNEVKVENNENVDEKLNSIKAIDESANQIANFQTIQSFVNFDYDSFKVKNVNKEVSYQKLEKAQKILIEGHTDTKGTNEYNFALGLKRANSVRDLLVEHNITKSKLEVVSFGETSPISTKDSENRRVDLKITYK